MRRHGRGGLLLIVPSASDSWRESIVQPMPYAVSPAFCELAELARQYPAEIDRRPWQESLGRAVDAIAGLTAVDGALLLTDRFEVVGFGAKIARRKGWAQVEEVRVSEPVVGGSAAVARAEELGGTRHLAAVGTGEQGHRRAQLDGVDPAQDGDGVVRPQLQQRRRRLDQARPEHRVGEVRAGLVEPADRVVHRRRTHPQARHLREHEPDPVPALAPGPQLGERTGVGAVRLLGIDESL